MTFDQEVRHRVIEYDPPRTMYLGDQWVEGFQPSSFYATVPYQKSCDDFVHRGPPYKTGGPLLIKERSYNHEPSSRYRATRQTYTNADTVFINGHWGANPSPTFAGFPQWWSTDLSAEGAKGWRKFRPGKPVANVGQMVGELISLPPSMPLRKIMKARTAHQFIRRAGRDYLNVEWGWKLLLNDIQQIYHLTKTLDRRLKQLRRDNGASVRRRGKVTTWSDTTVSKTEKTTGSYLYPVLNSVFYVPGSTRTRQLTIEESVESWFSAKFRYFIEDTMDPDTGWNQRAVGALFGLNPSPSLLWELLPWSWLIDWGVNVGDVISNASANAVDNLVAEYAYIMETHSLTYTSVAEGLMYVNDNGDKQHVAATAVARQISKARESASPYGFGVTSDSLSAKQKKILAALAVSRRW